jgi:hypothetical protein
MAEATFILRAVDATKAAFASVQNSLAKLETRSQTAAGFLKKAFDPRALGAGFAAALGLSLTSVLDFAIKQLVEFVNRAEKVRKILIDSNKEVTKILEEGDFARLNSEDKLASIDEKRLNNAKEILRLKEATKSVDAPMMLTNLRAESFAPLKTQLGTVEQAEKLSKMMLEDAKLADDRSNLLMQIEKRRRDQASEARVEREKDSKSLTDTLFENMQAEVEMSIEIDKAYADNFLKEQERAQRSIELLQLVTDARLGQKNEQVLSDVELGKSLKDSVMTPLQRYLAETDRLSQQFKSGVIPDQKTFNRLIEQAGNNFAETEEKQRMFVDSLGATTEELDRLKVVMAEMEMAQDAGSLIAQGFEDAILSGQKLSEVVRSLGRDLVRLVFQQMVTQRLAAGVTGVLQGKGFAGFMAAGGPVSAGSSYVVGEQGPELFVPHASGTIVPNNKMGGGSGSSSGGVTVNYNIAAGVSRAELVPILDQERRRLKAEIPDMVRRGGGYRAAFA